MKRWLVLLELCYDVWARAARLRANRAIPSGHSFSSLYAQTHVGIMVRRRVSMHPELPRDACGGTYNTKPWAAEWILVRSGKMLSPVLQMVLRRKDRPLKGSSC